jgi:LPXTG-motif cell wall-anchored protein
VNGSQSFSSETVAQVPASTFSGSTGGDGWDVFFYENYVLNIFHHNNYVALNCLLRTTGTLCPGYDPTQTSGAAHSKFNGYQAADRSGGWALTTTGEVYAFTAEESSDKPGVLCINVTTAPPTNCGFIPLSSDTNVDGYWYLSNAEGAGGRLFGLESKNNKLLCFDPTRNAACTGSPVMLLGSSATDTGKYHVYPLGDKVFASTDTHLYCFESSTLANCAGAWPVSYASLPWTAVNISPVAHMNATGTIDGVCMWNGCLDLTGAKRTGSGWVNPHSITTWSTNANNNGSSGQYGRNEAVSGRAYLPMVLGDHEIFCFDYATEAACVGFDTTPKLTDYSLYAVRADPNNPGCIWYNSDPGSIGLFDAFTGEASCASNPVITLQPASFAPRYACSSTRGVDEWNLLQLKSLAGTGTASSIKLTVRDPLGNAVSGWTDKPIVIGTSYDMSGLDVGTSGSRPTFNFALSGVTGGSITSATVSLDYVGKGPELCVNTVLTASSACPVISGTATSFIDSVGGTATYNKSRSLTIGTDPTVCAQSLREMTVPDPPRNVSPSSDSMTTAKVVFDVPADDGGSAIRDYKYSMDDGVTWTSVTPTVRADGKLEFGLSSLSAGRTYSLRILATNAIGRSTSVTASVTTLTAAQVAAASAVTTVAPAATVVPATTVAPKSPVVKAKALPVTGQQGSNSTALLAVVLLLSGCGILVTNHRRKIRFHS